MLDDTALPVNYATDILVWYDRNRRRLPWRALPGETPDPYRVWLSEIMLQQTGVKTVGPYFEAFTQRWPTIQAMAADDIEDVLKAWAGLGYYSRARNLYACARKVVDEYGGVFPDTVEGLRTLPGIGAYTAAAVASIAFNRRAAVVDGNIERVTTRLFALQTPLPQVRPEISARVDGMTPADRPGDFAQAMMDLGATICTPKRPACGLCPFFRYCEARLLGTQESFPFKTPKARRPLRSGAAFWAVRPDGWVLVRKRPDKGLLGGMTEIPSTVWSEDFDISRATEMAPVKAKWRKLPGTVQHGFTHFELTVTVFAADVPMTTKAPEGSRWVRLVDLDGEALPTVMRKMVKLARG